MDCLDKTQAFPSLLPQAARDAIPQAQITPPSKVTDWNFLEDISTSGRGNRRGETFLDDDDRRHFLKTLGEDMMPDPCSHVSICPIATDCFRYVRLPNDKVNSALPNLVPDAL